jgi:WD repeat-containing protein 19
MKRLFTVDDKYHGHGRVTFVWHRNHLACAGGNGLVHVFNRQGEQIDEIALVKQGRVIIDWDHEGEHLAVLQEGGDSVTIWNLSSRWVKTVDLGFKDPSFMRWSRQGSELAIGTCSGNLLLYNLDSRKKIPVIGKHTSIILCGDWSNKNNVLALGSDDKSMTFSSASGETLSQTRFAVGPTSVQFAQPLEKSTSSPLDDDWGTKTGGSTVAKSDRISVNLGKRKIQIYEDTDMKAEPITIDFPDKYGKIKRYIWFEEGYLVVGFAKGTMLVLSVQDEFLEAKTGSPKSKRYKKLCSFPLFDEHLREMKYCANLRKLACVGDDCVKIVEYTGSGSWQVNKSETIRLEGSPSITSVAWTQDGQILSIGTSKGCVHNFVATMPLLYDRFGSSMVHMTSLREASIRSRPGGKSRKITLEMEPAFVALGARHFAAGMNSRVWFYASSNEDDDGEDDDSKTRDDLDDEDVWSPCGEKEYLSSVELVRLGHGCAAVLCGDGRVYLHSLDGEESAVFPEHQNDVVTCVALTSQLLIYGTRDGHLRYFSLQDWASLNGCEIRHTSGIQRIFPNQEGTRVIFVDDHGSGFMHSASGSSTVLISEIGNASGSIRVC